jgi:hypothetical protein
VEYYSIMNTKVSVVFSIIAIAAAVLLFAASPVITIHQAFADENPCPGYDYGSGFGPGFGPGFGDR